MIFEEESVRASNESDSVWKFSFPGIGKESVGEYDGGQKRKRRLSFWRSTIDNQQTNQRNQSDSPASPKRYSWIQTGQYR